ncbi:uncharacterized protein N7496_010896 [Penicillium cataractarum]|uniref:Enoyl reductase (ER) domain-containing protein n=1 Tax=Penicillium cataractarum TaxID=2100454 RepID=A0A9W9RJ39_9EURO|nr:uncharacterized protein N7496_010896 [Penicillium cataractarum]KAJ5358483.1 hypothetical protein N7496_010896 [Penicillium cataractarum]
MKAIKIVGSRRAKVTTKAAMPELAPDCVLIKTKAVALNPTDWKHIDFISIRGATVGCDYAGIIEEIGAEVDPAHGLQVGDRVAGFNHGFDFLVMAGNGENLSDGSFAEYIAVKAHINIKLPDWVSFADGATLAVGITTVAQGMYQQLQLPLPDPSFPLSTQPGAAKEPILIYGGSTATGTLAIQFAKLYVESPTYTIHHMSDVLSNQFTIRSGYTVITTCSPHNFELVRARGADHVLDHHSPALAQDIRALTGNQLCIVLDCITTGESIIKCCDALAPPSPDRRLQYCGLFTVGALPRADVEAGFTMAYTALGESFQKWDNYYPGSVEDAQFIGDFMKLTSRLLEGRQVQTHPAEVGEGGLDGVLKGLDRLRRGDVSGVKLVYTL